MKEYEKHRVKLDDIKVNRGKLAMLRTQAKWVEEGENAPSIFLEWQINGTQKPI